MRAAELIRDVYGLAISPGALVAWVGKARTVLQGTADLMAQYLRAGRHQSKVEYNRQQPAKSSRLMS